MQHKQQHARRSFVKIICGGVVMTMTANLYGCGEERLSDHSLSDADLDAQYRTIRDIQTYVQGIPNFTGSILKARDLAKGEPVTLMVDEGSHRHKFTLSKDQLAKLLSGGAVVMTTELAAGHRHTMVIDPAHQPIGGGETVELPLPSTTNQSDAKLYAALSDDDQPLVYVEASEALAAENTEYCVGSVAACDGDVSKWRPLQRSDKFSARQVFVTSEELTVADGTLLNIKGKTERSGQAVRLLLKFLSR